MVSENAMRKAAKNIVRTNFNIKEKDVVLIDAGPNSLRFAEMLSYECSMVGAQPMIAYSSDDLALRTYKDVKVKFLRNKPRLGFAHLKVVDAEMSLDDSNPFLARKIPQDKVEVRRQAVKPLRKIREQMLTKKKLKSALIGFPTREDAKAQGIPFAKLDRIFWETLAVDYYKIAKFNDRMLRLMKGARQVRIVGPRTDLIIGVHGRHFISDCGIVDKEEFGFMNLPAGEIFIAPEETKANGEIYFDLPCSYHYGKQVKGVWFKLKDGKVVKYRIDKGQADFEDIIKHASGDKLRIAELGIGTNPKARPTGGMIIVDEKILGTVHMAIGQNLLYGGKNEATIHWDFFKTMGKGTAVFVDGKVAMKDGKWLV
jgi:aminopeptidase